MPSGFFLREFHPLSGQTNPFDEFPELLAIWSPDLARIAKEAIDEAREFAVLYPGYDHGRIFLVFDENSPERPAGITGILPWDENVSAVGLRWHGLAPQYRSLGLSGALVEAMRALACAQYPQAKEFVEFMPDAPEHAAIRAYFEKIGFARSGAPVQVDWSPLPWQEYRADLRAPLKISENQPGAGALPKSPKP